MKYQNGLLIHVNGSHDTVWQIEHDGRTYVLPPASFFAWMSDGPLVYSADVGTGRIDFAKTAGYLYCDTRAHRAQVGAMSLEGAALLLEHEWEIDILPVQTNGEIEVDVSRLWPNRRLPPLRLLAFRPDEDEPETVRAASDKGRVTFEPSDAYCRYRIALPEWMVEPGR